MGYLTNMEHSAQMWHIEPKIASIKKPVKWWSAMGYLWRFRVAQLDKARFDTRLFNVETTNQVGV